MAGRPQARRLSPFIAPSGRRRHVGVLERRRGALAAAALVALAGAAVGIAIGVPDGPSFLVPAGRDGFPGWLGGPLAGWGPELGPGSFSVLVLVMCAAYAAALAVSDAVRPAWAVAAVVGAHLALGLAAPILSADVFGYIGYARLGAVHGLDPYLSTAEAVPRDPVYPFVGWKGLSSPYGPLFTLASYALAPLGVAAGLWTLKALVTAAGIASVGLVAGLAGRMGGSRVAAALFVGLNPVALVWGIGGAHNDALVTVLVLGAIVLALGDRERAAAVTVACAAAVKATAGLVLPFLLLGARRPARALSGAALAALALIALSLAVFGTGTIGYLGVLADQGRFVSLHAIPHELARLLGLAGVDAQGRYTIAPVIRVGALVALLATLAALAVWVRRGGDWIAAAGWATVALLVTTTFLLPWYVVWLLPLAALAASRALRLSTLALCAWIVVTRLPLLAG